MAGELNLEMGKPEAAHGYIAKRVEYKYIQPGISCSIQTEMLRLERQLEGVTFEQEWKHISGRAGGRADNAVNN